MTNQTQGTPEAPLTTVPTRGEKWKARFYHMAKGINNIGNDIEGEVLNNNFGAAAVSVAIGVVIGAAAAIGAAAVGGDAVSAAAVTAVGGGVGGGVGVGLAATFVVMPSTKKHADKISEPAKKTWRKLGVALLAAVSLTTGAAVGKIAYDGFNAQEAERQKAEAAELAAPRAKYTLECLLTAKEAEKSFNDAVQNGGAVTIPQGCKLSLQR